MAIQVAYTLRHRQRPGRDVAAPGGVCDSITSKFRCVDFARQPQRKGAASRPPAAARARQLVFVEAVAERVPSAGTGTIPGMPQNFIESHREQGFLLPPDVRDWLPP